METVVLRRRMYGEFAGAKMAEFWVERWSEDVACSFYRWALPIDDVAANASHDLMGEIMSTTYIACCDMAWRCGMSPRIENALAKYDLLYYVLLSTRTSLTYEM